jgi:tetratricopeptide (TPR) repeat protein
MTMMRGSTLAAALLVLGLPALAGADIRTVGATGEYRMGDNDTRTDAKRLALLDAKRLALERVGTYLEGVTEVKHFGLSRDEIRAYTAGIVEVTEQATRTAMEGETTVVRVDVHCKIDTAALTKQIAALRQNEEAKAELVQAREESERLRRELEAKSKELAAMKSKREAVVLVQQREQVLNRADANGLLAHASVSAASIGSMDDDRRPGAFAPRNPKTSNLPIAGVNERKLLEQALALDPSNAMAHQRLGVLLMHEHNPQAAERQFRAALRLRPDDAKSHFGLGAALAKTGRRAEAVRELHVFLQLAPDTPENQRLILRARTLLARLERR